MWGIQWKGLRGGDRSNLRQLLDCGSIVTLHLTLVSLRELFENRIVAEGSIFVRWSSCISPQFGLRLLLPAEFQSDNSLVTLARSTPLLIFSFYFDIPSFGVTMSLMSLPERR